MSSTMRVVGRLGSNKRTQAMPALDEKSYSQYTVKEKVKLIQYLRSLDADHPFKFMLLQRMQAAEAHSLKKTSGGGLNSILKILNRQLAPYAAEIAAEASAARNAQASAVDYLTQRNIAPAADVVVPQSPVRRRV